MAGLGWDIWVFATAVTLAAGFVKGVVGFAMPMIMISGLATLLPPDLALHIQIIRSGSLRSIDVHTE